MAASTVVLPFMTRDTVESDTPASDATSAIVGPLRGAPDLDLATTTPVLAAADLPNGRPATV
ncbi:hypothetical protein ACO2Q7_11590 [Rathayibacter sp. KR2-224]|uniref:hypothetical protein n=1 Tax=Rathayibacter sp. KR2-224 TaxID=3400913 RepID=UPI003C06EC50